MLTLYIVYNTILISKLNYIIMFLKLYLVVYDTILYSTILNSINYYLKFYFLFYNVVLITMCRMMWTLSYNTVSNTI